MKREKKSESLEIRLGHEQKQKFMALCRERGSTASDVLRSFITGFIDDAERTATAETAPSRLKELSMILRRNPRKAFTASASMFGAFALFAASPSVADDDIFKRLDENGDGLLTAEELTGPSSGGYDATMTMIETMDLDNDGALSESEFHSPKGCVVRREDNLKDDGTEKNRTISLNVTAYDFSDPEMSKISSVTSDMLVDGDLSDEEVQQQADKMQADMSSRIQKETGDPEACQPREGGQKIEKRIEKSKEIKKSRQ